jgi:beta-lactamase class A
LTDLIREPGLALSLRNLLEIMLLVSDNTATDLCLRHAGGGEGVTARMRMLGIEGLRVDRSTLELISDWKGLSLVPGNEERDPAKYGELLDSVSREKADAAERAFEDDPRDTATPRAMAALLEKIWKREALSPESTDLLLDIMKRCRTGEGRLKGILPGGTEVAHKTGTIGRTLNDVGIITLPNGAGHVIVAAFVKASSRPESERERAIAEAARAAHDYFLFAASP